MKGETPGIDDLRGCEFVGSALFFFFLGCVGWGGGLMLPIVLTPVTTAKRFKKGCFVKEYEIAVRTLYVSADLKQQQ